MQIETRADAEPGLRHPAEEERGEAAATGLSTGIAAGQRGQAETRVSDKARRNTPTLFADHGNSR